MGLCISISYLCISKTDHNSSRGGSKRRSSNPTVKVIQVDGRLQELKHPIEARSVTSHYPNCFLCSSELMSVGSFPPQVPDDDVLQPNQIYFLVPLSQAQTHLSLPGLCSMAVKANAALPQYDVIRLSSVK